MKRTLFAFIILLLSFGNTTVAQTTPKERVNTLLENWHQAAAEADFNEYFNKMAEASVFIGTDPTENWNKPDFMDWSKPYFDRGKAWSFSTLERNIFFHEKDGLAWFDELLDTQMGICRGSGVVIKEDGEWKIKHYVLSIAIPNENVDVVTGLKADFDQKLIKQLRNQ